MADKEELRELAERRRRRVLAGQRNRMEMVGGGMSTEPVESPPREPFTRLESNEALRKTPKWTHLLKSLNLLAVLALSVWSALQTLRLRKECWTPEAEPDSITKVMTGAPALLQRSGFALFALVEVCFTLVINWRRLFLSSSSSSASDTTILEGLAQTFGFPPVLLSLVRHASSLMLLWSCLQWSVRNFFVYLVAYQLSVVAIGLVYT